MKVMSELACKWNVFIGTLLLKAISKSFVWKFSKFRLTSLNSISLQWPLPELMLQKIAACILRGVCQMYFCTQINILPSHFLMGSKNYNWQRIFEQEELHGDTITRCSFSNFLFPAAKTANNFDRCWMLRNNVTAGFAFLGEGGNPKWRSAKNLHHACCQLFFRGTLLIWQFHSKQNLAVWPCCGFYACATILRTASPAEYLLLVWLSTGAQPEKVDIPPEISQYNQVSWNAGGYLNGRVHTFHAERSRFNPWYLQLGLGKSSHSKKWSTLIWICCQSM